MENATCTLQNVPGVRLAQLTVIKRPIKITVAEETMSLRKK
jgi:hypothetical protein